MSTLPSPQITTIERRQGHFATVAEISGKMHCRFRRATVHRIQVVRLPLWDEITHQSILWQLVRYELTLNRAVSFLSSYI